jgi:hypothetical protein
MSAPSRPKIELISLVGWLFADLLLALVLIFLASQPGDPTALDRAEAARGIETTTTTTTTTTVPPTTTTTIPPGVDNAYGCFVVTTDPAILENGSHPDHDQQLRDVTTRVQEGLERVGLGGRRAGIVLSFGVVNDEPGAGTQLAETFNELVLPRLPGVFAGPAGLTANRALWSDLGPNQQNGMIEVNVYPLIQGELPEDRTYGNECVE